MSLFAGKRLVLFDAGFTLLLPDPSPLDVYLEQARQLGIEIEHADFAPRFVQCWRRLDAEFRSADPELRSSDEHEVRMWRAFTAELAEPFPALFARRQEWTDRLFRWFDQPSAWRVADQVQELLTELQARGLQLGIVSNWHSALTSILRGLGLADHFAFILTSAAVGYKKPSPKIFAAAITQAAVRPEETIHIGDSWDDDIVGAQAVGITPIWLNAQAPNPVEGVTTIRRIADLR